MWRFLWQRGVLSMAVTTLSACVLLGAPSEWTEACRSRLRDALRPGAAAWLTIRDGMTDVAARTRDQCIAWLRPWVGAASGGAPALSTPEVETLTETIRRLEARLAWQERELAAAQHQLNRHRLVHSSEPLLRVTAIPARVIAADREGADHLRERLLDLGRTAGIAADDLVLSAGSGRESSAFPLLDQGSAAGVHGDAPVGAGGTLVGRIRTCGAWTSTLQLLTDPDFRIAAQIVRSTGDESVLAGEGIFAGGGAGPCRLELVPSTAPVAVGDRVYMHESLCGEGVALFIGTIQAAELPEGAPHWNLLVSTELEEPPPRVEVLSIELNPVRVVQQSVNEAGDPSHRR